MNPFIELAFTIIDIYIYILIINAVMSWLVAGQILRTDNKFVIAMLYAAQRLTNPLLNPIRNFLPNLGGVDISPVVLIVLLSFIKRFIVYYFFI
jgi:YggT family protein|tara:strand:+ start:230 stop:511 length:282 start_codon:yes stop_codon:yes gene_type:complete